IVNRQTRTCPARCGALSTRRDRGGVSRAAKGADCKSAGLAFVGSSPTSPTKLKLHVHLIPQQRRGRFRSDCPLPFFTGVSHSNSYLGYSSAPKSSQVSRENRSQRS